MQVTITRRVPVNTLEELASTTARVADRAGPATVGIGSGWGQGSGVVMRAGLVLTNAHNLRNEATVVTFSDGRVTEGSVRGVDIDGDLAVLDVDTAGATPLEWSSTPVSLGTPVLALANPGGRGLRVTLGQVSAVGQAFRGPRGRRVTGTIEHTAPLVKGSSGGPVVDVHGRLLGVNVNRLGEGFYLAIPADDDLRSRIDALAVGSSPTRRRLGVALAPSRVARRLRAAVGLAERDGLLVQGLEEGGPAERSGMRIGDLVVAASDRPMTSVDDLHRALDALGDGEALALTVVRGNDEVTVAVSFGASGDEASPA